MTDSSDSGQNGQGRDKFRVAGDKVIATIVEWIREWNLRRVVITNDEGRTLIEFPVTIGVAGAVLMPVWAAVGAIAAIVTNCTIEVERTDESADDDEPAEADEETGDP